MNLKFIPKSKIITDVPINKCIKCIKWSESDKQTCLILYEQGMPYKKIGKQINRTESSIIRFIVKHATVDQKIKRKGPESNKYQKTRERIAESKEESRLEEIRRMKVYNLGLTDKLSSIKLMMPHCTFTAWRKSRHLEATLTNRTVNKDDDEMSIYKYRQLQPPKKKMVAFQPEDIENYHHLKHEPLKNYSSPITVILDKQEAERQLMILGIIQRESTKRVFKLNGILLGHDNSQDVTEYSLMGGK